MKQLLITIGAVLLVGCGQSYNLEGNWLVSGYNCYDGNKPITAEIKVSITQKGNQIRAVKNKEEFGIKNGMLISAGKMEGDKILGRIYEYSPPPKRTNSRVKIGGGMSSLPATFLIKDKNNIILVDGDYRSGWNYELENGKISGKINVNNTLSLSRITQ